MLEPDCRITVSVSGVSLILSEALSRISNGARLME